MRQAARDNLPGGLCVALVVCYSTGMSIRCGQCKGRHETAAQVRACYAQAAPRIDTPSDAANRMAATLMTALRPAQVAQERPAELAPTEPGFYSSGPRTYRLDAQGQWFQLQGNGRFSGPCRAPYRPWRMSVEDVAAKGRIMVRCIVCGTPLRKKESREAGIGPVCAGKV